MVKKISILILISIALIIAFSTQVSAKEMKLTDLEKELESLEQTDEKFSNLDSFYIIGNYVFTSNYRLDTKDIMLAAKSINLSQEYDENSQKQALDEMAIFQLQRTYENYEPTGWKILKNYVGTTSLTDEAEFNIQYIDYNYLKELYTVTFDTQEGSEIDSIQVLENEKIDPASIPTPEKTGYKFKGWVIEKDGVETPFDFETENVKSSITLKATWYVEVDTDNLLEEAIETITNNENYGLKFAEKVITYNIYDMNKNYSEIQEKALEKLIKELLKDENVYFIKIGTKTFTSPIVQDEQIEKDILTELINKEYEEILQSDLEGKTLNLLVKLKEDIACSKDNKESEEYSIKFVYEPHASINAEIPQKEQNWMQENWNYKTENTYSISNKNEIYKVSGYVTQQEEVTAFGENSSKFYFAYSIELDEDVNLDDVKVKIPKKENAQSDEDYNIVEKEAFAKDEKENYTHILVGLMEVKEKEETTYRDIIIEIDGVPTKIRIDFTDLKLENNSNFTISKDLPIDDGTVDIDKQGKESAPYTITVDDDNIDFYIKSTSTEANIANDTDEVGDKGCISSEDKQQIIENDGYKLENSGEIEL